MGFIWIGQYPSEAISLAESEDIKTITKYEFKQFVRSHNYPGSFIDYIFLRLNELQVDSEHDEMVYFDRQWAFALFSRHPELSTLSLNSSDEPIYSWLNNKGITRRWMYGVIELIDSTIMEKEEISFEAANVCFSGYEKYVIQFSPSRGGNGTYVLDERNADAVKAKLPSHTPLIVAPYIDHSIPINVTGVIFDNEVITFPLSVQLIREEDDQLKYIGSDFIEPRNFNKIILERCREAAKRAFEKLRIFGYRGVCGIDLIIRNENVYFIEINPRFQGSSILINRELRRNSLPTLIDLEKCARKKSLLLHSKQPIEEIAVNESYIRYKNYSSYYDATPIETNEASAIYNVQISDSDKADHSSFYYDHFANLYHLMLPDWDNFVDSQAKVLPGFIAKLKPDAQTLLDSTCGIGTQVIGLAEAGFEVFGLDLSEREILWALEELKRRHLEATLKVGDCRQIQETFKIKFDVIISIDSSLVHLLNEKNVLEALNSAWESLKDEGLYIVSLRDYGKLKTERPSSPYKPRVAIKDNKRFTTLRTWDWGEKLLHSRQYVIEEDDAKRIVHCESYDQWPITKDEILALAEKSMFKQAHWLDCSSTGFYQPIIVMKKHEY